MLMVSLLLRASVRVGLVGMQLNERWLPLEHALCVAGHLCCQVAMGVLCRRYPASRRNNGSGPVGAGMVAAEGSLVA